MFPGINLHVIAAFDAAHQTIKELETFKQVFGQHEFTMLDFLDQRTCYNPAERVSKPVCPNSKVGVISKIIKHRNG